MPDTETPTAPPTPGALSTHDDQGRLLVMVGDVIQHSTGDQTTAVLIAWTNRSYTPGARDAAGTDLERPSARATPVDAIVLVAPVGDDQFAGTATVPGFLEYQGWITPTDTEIDRAIDLDPDHDLLAREGHMWAVTHPGYRHVTHDWWEMFRTTPPHTIEETL